MNRNLLIFVLGLNFALFSLNSHAETRKEHFNCQSSSASHIIDTSYMLIESDNDYQLIVKYAPGRIPLDPDPLNSVRIGDIEYIKERARLFSRIPLEFSLNFEKKNCKKTQKNSEILWNCYIFEPGQLGKLNYKNLAFFLYSQSVTSAFTQSKLYNIGIEFGLSPSEAYGANATIESKKLSEIQDRDSWDDLPSATVNRSMVVAFENSEDQQSCYLAD